MEHSDLTSQLRNVWIAILLLIAGIRGHAQNQYLSFGTGGTPMALGGDYRALGWNPAQISFSPLNHADWKSAAGGFEFGARLSSTALSRGDIWNSLLNRGNGSIDDWSGDDWNQYVDLLTNESITLNADVLTAASSKKWRNWAVAYSNTQHFQAEAYFDATPIQLLVQGGGGEWAALFDSLLTDGGAAVENTGDFSAEELLSFQGGININGDGLIAELLQESRLGFSYQRCHTLGISKAWKLGDFILHTGVSGQLILGNGYFSVKTTDGNLDAFGAFSNGFNYDALATLQNGVPNSFEEARKWGPVGQGWGLDFGGVLELKDQFWISTAISDLGRVEWRGERYSVNTALTTWATPVEDPTNVGDLMLGALSPNTWFNEAALETRVIPNGIKFQLGGGMHFGKFLMLAGEMAFDNPDLIGNAGTRLGATAVISPVRFIRIDLGLSKWGNETYRIPAGFTLRSGNRGFECGLQATDIQVLWKESQSEIGFRAIVMRWVW